MLAIYQREILILRKRFFRQLASMSVSPLLYLIAFGMGMGRDVKVDGHSYLQFLIPGLVAMNCMIQAFAIAGEINIARFYWHIFEEFQAAPIRNISYVSGEVLAGITRALFSVLLILLIAALSGVVLSYNFYFWLAVALNSFVFASLAVGLAHASKIAFRPGTSHQLLHYSDGFFGGNFFSCGQNAGMGAVHPSVSAAYPCLQSNSGGCLRPASRFFILSAARCAWNRSFRPCLPLR